MPVCVCAFECAMCFTNLTVKALRFALYHELEDEIPDGDYNVGYFEGSQHKKKWLVSSADLVAMYTHFKGKKHIPLWCDGKVLLIPMMMNNSRKNKDVDTHAKKVSEQ